MATIVATDTRAGGVITVTETTLDGSSDTFTYDSGLDLVLVLRNPTGGAISPVIDGDGGTTVQATGAGPVDISGGLAVGSIATGATVVLPLRSWSAYMQGSIDITSGTGLVAVLLEGCLKSAPMGPNSVI
ncbi:MAG: hypothetical protein GKR98_09665 [Boseongicola sp.]|nr:MAG: hypothetical protein GKR98_09665 [Boseongicola sp.]